MAEQNIVGTAPMIPMPGSTSVAKQAQKQLLYSTVGFDRRGGVAKAGQGVIAEGQVMAVETATNKLVKYNSAGADGSQTALGIALNEVDTTGADQFINVGISGSYIEAQLVGLIAAAKTSLGGRSIPLYGAFKF